MGIPSSHENLNEKLGLNALILVIGRAATLEQGEALHLWSPAWQPITLLAMHSCRAHLHRSVVSARDDCYSVPRWKGTARARASHLDASGWRVVRQLRARPRVRAMGSNEPDADVIGTFEKEAKRMARPEEEAFLAEMSKESKPSGTKSAQDRLKAAMAYKAARSAKPVEETCSEGVVGQGSGEGSAGQGARDGGPAGGPAGFLDGVLGAQAQAEATAKDPRRLELEEKMRSGAISMEQYTVQLEELRRASTSVEFISIDKDYAPTTGSPASDYQPKVATWGVFPRPKNISNAFGGGRNLPPGQALESEEERKEAQRRTREALARNRQSAGLVTDEGDEAAAQIKYDEGMALMKAGRLEEAAEVFEQALALVPTRGTTGGMAALQRAICLDSMGRGDEARALYRQLERHSIAYVARTAKRMSFGFAAMKSLKTDTISFMATKAEWRPYFDTFTDRRYRAYVRPEGEEDDVVVPLAASIAVVALPLVVVGSFVLQR